MTKDHTVSIRNFDRNDREDVRRICRATAFLGEPLGFCFDDELLADTLTLPFTDYEPGSCFVAVREDRVVGYVIGTTDSAKMKRLFKTRVLPRLFAGVMFRGTLFRQKARRFLFHTGISLLKGEFSTSGFSNDYPATLHINIDADLRGMNVGTRLMNRYLEFLRNEGVKGVHVSTMGEEAKSFFEKQGFRVLFEGKRTHLRYCLGKDLPFYILGKRL